MMGTNTMRRRRRTKGDDESDDESNDEYDEGKNTRGHYFCFYIINLKNK